MPACSSASWCPAVGQSFPEAWLGLRKERYTVCKCHRLPQALRGRLGSPGGGRQRSRCGPQGPAAAQAPCLWPTVGSDELPKSGRRQRLLGTQPPAFASCSPLPEVRGAAYLSAELSRGPVPPEPFPPCENLRAPCEEEKQDRLNPRAGAFLCRGHFDACSFIHGPFRITNLRISLLRMECRVVPVVALAGPNPVIVGALYDPPSIKKRESF